MFTNENWKKKKWNFLFRRVRVSQHFLKFIYLWWWLRTWWFMVINFCWHSLISFLFGSLENIEKNHQKNHTQTHTHMRGGKCFWKFLNKYYKRKIILIWSPTRIQTWISLRLKNFSAACLFLTPKKKTKLIVFLIYFFQFQLYNFTCQFSYIFLVIIIFLRKNSLHTTLQTTLPTQYYLIHIVRVWISD